MLSNGGEGESKERSVLFLSFPNLSLFRPLHFLSPLLPSNLSCFLPRPFVPYLQSWGPSFSVNPVIITGVIFGPLIGLRVLPLSTIPYKCMMFWQESLRSLKRTWSSAVPSPDQICEGVWKSATSLWIRHYVVCEYI